LIWRETLPGVSYECIWCSLALVAGSDPPNATTRRARALAAHAVTGAEKDGIVEWK
jgi:hypothetical protein